MNKGRIVVFFGITMMLFLTAVSVVSGQSRTYGGRATGVILYGDTTMRAGDTGELPSAGGSIIMTTPRSSLPGITTGMIMSSTSGTGNAAQSSSTVNNVTVSAGGYVITATSVTANAQCICCPGEFDAECNGNSVIQGLTITDPSGNPVPVTVAGQPNQVVVLPNGAGTITINEQTSDVSELTVNAIHVNISSGGTMMNAVIASATTMIVCGTTGPTPADVTVGGTVLTSNGQPISGVSLVLTSAEGESVSTTSNNFGQFTFPPVEAGHTYIVTASRKGYTFQAVAIMVNEDIVDLEIRANP
ncbi:MAG TPA: carboxypeptidase-like regulatory domain-containing protein [Pyrinomonadaceae bacterium]|nr:carboxypeptidase-like regulatory domain-containing protein [Pyrinomonadaceae bacterium]